MNKVTFTGIIRNSMPYFFPPKAGSVVPRIKYRRLIGNADDKKYVALNTITYYSKRYNREATVTRGDRSDGATGAIDIKSDAWWIHDQLCVTGAWDDGTKICNWDASTVIGDILWSEGHRRRSIYWWFATFFGGGGKARENGMMWLK